MITRRYYHTKIIGTGKPHIDPFRAVTSCLLTANKYKSGMIDLLDGTCLSYADTDQPVNDDIISDNLVDKLGNQISSKLSTRFGIDVASLALPDAVFKILNSKKLLIPEHDGQKRIYLGSQIYGTPRKPFGHGTITEDFNGADKAGVGYDQTWTESVGTAWENKGNQAYCGGYTQAGVYISSVAMSSQNHYAQAVLKALTRAGDDVGGLIIARYNSTYTFYMMEAVNIGGTLQYWLNKWIDGAETNLDSDPTDPAVNDVMRLICNGSSITANVNGTELLVASDSSITDLYYVGLAYSGWNAGNSVAFDDFEASELVATAAVTGTATASITEANVVTGGKTIIITLTGDTWVATVGADNAITTALIAGIDSAQSEATGWDAVVKANMVYTDTARTSNTVVTITLGAEVTYNITATETITVTIPASAVTLAAQIVATPTFTVAPVVSGSGGARYIRMNPLGFNFFQG